jgi:predicted PurR-regulated permease PerM
VAAACLVVLVAGLKAAGDIFLPFLLALFVAVLSLPLISWLRRHRVPGGVAVLLTVLAVLGVLTALGLVLTSSIASVADAVPRYEARFLELLEPYLARLEARGLRVSEGLASQLLNLDRVAGLAADAFAEVASIASTGLLVALIAVFLLLESLHFGERLAAALGREDALGRYGRITREVQRYLAIKTAVGLATGTLAGLWLWILGVDFPLFWGFATFLLHFIPNLGSVVAGALPALLALVQLGPRQALLVVLGFLALNMVLGNVVEPGLMGRRLGLSPVVVLVSLLFWGFVWGLAGTFLAVPLTMVLKILFENTASLRWLALLMDPHPQPPPPPSSAPPPSPAAG